MRGGLQQAVFDGRGVHAHQGAGVETEGPGFHRQVQAPGAASKTVDTTSLDKAEVVPLIPAGFNPHAYEPRAEDIKRISGLLEDVEAVTADLRDAAQTHAMLERVQPGCIVNLAALTKQGFSADDAAAKLTKGFITLTQGTEKLRKAGLDVIVAEKAPVFGGTTAFSGGVLWIPGNPHARAAGVVDSRAAAREYLLNETGVHFDAATVDDEHAAAREADGAERAVGDFLGVHLVAGIAVAADGGALRVERRLHSVHTLHRPRRWLAVAHSAATSHRQRPCI